MALHKNYPSSLLFLLVGHSSNLRKNMELVKYEVHAISQSVTYWSKKQESTFFYPFLLFHRGPPVLQLPFLLNNEKYSPVLIEHESKLGSHHTKDVQSHGFWKPRESHLFKTKAAKSLWTALEIKWWSCYFSRLAKFLNCCSMLK